MRVLLNTLPLYGKGEGVRTYTAELLQNLHHSNEDMEWHLVIRPEDLERLELKGDRRFAIAPAAKAALPPQVPGVRFAWRNTTEHILLPRHGTHYDLVHFMDSHGPMRQPHQPPLVLTVHDVIPLNGDGYYSRFIGWYLATMMRSSVPQAQAIIAVSNATAQQITELLPVPRERITVVPLGVSPRFRLAGATEQARVTEAYHLSRPYIISVCTIEPRKNIARLVRAFAQAKRSHDLPHDLVLAGKLGWKHDDVDHAIAEADLGDAIHMLGFVPDEDLPPLMAGADALVYPSLVEGFGLPLLEAMACGTPVITSATSSLAEVANGDGVLVDPLSEPSIAEAITRVCRDEALRTRLREAGLARARRHTWQKVAMATAEVYRQVVGVPAAVPVR